MATENHAINTTKTADSLAVGGTTQQQADLFQNLEKLIASAVSICRLDGSVQCQIGGLITVIEELQRLLRHSFAEIKKLEKNLEDQKHNQQQFTNNITNLHYQVQSTVEALKRQAENTQKAKENSGSTQPNSLNEDAGQVSLVDKSYGEESDTSITNNVNVVDNTGMVDGALAGSNQFDEDLKKPGFKKGDGTKGGQDASSERGTSPGADDARVPLLPNEDIINGDAEESLLDEIATSTNEEQESALSMLQSSSSQSSPSRSDSSEQGNKPMKKKRSLQDIAKALRIAKGSKSATRTQSHVTSKSKLFKKNVSKKLNKSAKGMSRVQKKKHSLPSSKSVKSPTLSSLKGKKELLTKLKKKTRASVKKESSSKVSTTKLPVKSRNSAKLGSCESSSISNLNNKSKDAKKSSGSADEKPIDMYINLDFVLNANQLMSELVADSNRQEATLDTVSNTERQHVVDLAKLYRLRVRMADKGVGELPVALIKGRESSLPKSGQVDRLLNTMAHAMVVKKNHECTRKSLLEFRQSRLRDTASPAKKRRV